MSSSSSRVQVRVNATTAGVGDRGAVYTADDSALLRGLARHGVVTITDTTNTPEATEDGEVDDPAPDGDHDPAPESEPEGEQGGGGDEATPPVSSPPPHTRRW